MKKDKRHSHEASQPPVDLLQANEAGDRLRFVKKNVSPKKKIYLGSIWDLIGMQVGLIWVLHGI